MCEAVVAQSYGQYRQSPPCVRQWSHRAMVSIDSRLHVSGSGHTELWSVYT
ncbi:hypothetical protein DPMN_170702 [Dreissena polymorpha]|uniref:Uncharacterized protein n=1 Tax=Dreissena polymorpha TaxID=45954 RepID=A0A9D4DXT9_DREPO|nr:hypothetical protein DPMN_170702 [Dreissena polymorpha]